MGWATYKEVYRHFRMLTPRQSFMRRFILSLFISSFLMLFYFFAYFISIFITLFCLTTIILPLIKLSSQPRGKQTAKGEAPVYTEPHSDADQASAGFLSSDLVKNFLRIALPAAFLGLTVFSLYGYESSYLSVSGLFLLYSFFSFNLIDSALERIERKEISEGTKNKTEKRQLSFYKFFAYPKNYFFIGRVGGVNIGLPREIRFQHFLVVGPTGAEKSTSFIIPPLLFDATSIGSAVVPDNKSPELLNWVAGRWIKYGKKVFLFDPWHPDSIGINPLPDADDQVLLDIVEVVMRERQEIMKEEAFFKSRTRYLLFSILKLVQSFKDDYCNLTSAYHVCESVVTLKDFIETSPTVIKKLFDDFFKLYSESQVNALTSIREKLDIFMDVNVRKAFSKSEFKLEMLFREKEPCLFVIGAPIDKREPGTKISSLLINLIINMAFRERRLQKQAIQRGDKSFVPNDLYLYLDELRNLKITALADLISIARDTKTQVIGSSTDLAFFKYYHFDSDSLMGNFRTKVITDGLDLNSAKYVSDSLGTDMKVSYKYFRGLMASQEEKPLLNPSEVTQIPKEEAVVFTPLCKPFAIDKVSSREPYLKKMQCPAPKTMRPLYEKWGVADGDLKDPLLPMISDKIYDMEKIKGNKPEDKLKTDVRFSIFKETGGGKFVPYEESELSYVVRQQEAPAEGFTEEEQKRSSNTDDLVVGGTLF